MSGGPTMKPRKRTLLTAAGEVPLTDEEAFRLLHPEPTKPTRPEPSPLRVVREGAVPKTESQCDKGTRGGQCETCAYHDQRDCVCRAPEPSPLRVVPHPRAQNRKTRRGPAWWFARFGMAVGWLCSRLRRVEA